MWSPGRSLLYAYRSNTNAMLVILMMKLVVKKTSCQSASPVFPLPCACAIQILWAATDDNILMGMQKEHRQPEPKLNQTHRHKPWLSLSVFFSVCPFFFWLGNVDLPSAFSSAVWALSSAKSRFLDICLQARLRISAQKFFFLFPHMHTYTKNKNVRFKSHKPNRM